MNLFRGRPAYPKDRDLARVVQAAASRLAEKLERVDPDSLDLSSETRGLFRERRMSIKGRVEYCAHIFAWALPRDEKPFSDLSLVAFNDGLGFFSLLAKECSVGTVVYHGTDDDLRRDARIIAKAIGNPADHYVFGDLEDLEFVMEKHSIPCDVFVSCDALEHLADPISFFDALTEISNGAMSFAIAGSRESRLEPVRAEEKRTLAGLRDDFDRAGFQTSLVPGRPAPRLKSIRSSLGGLVTRGSSLAPSSAPIPIANEGTSFILCGSRGSGRRPVGGRASLSRVDQISREPDEVLSR